jgi:hypothetical protein
MSDRVTDPVEHRLRRLESDWRVFRAAAAVLAVGVVASTTSAFRRHDVPSLRTDRLELIDPMGRVRATLSVGRDAAAWTVVDSTGRAVAALTLEETGQIAVRDAEGRVQATLGAATVHHLTER